MKKECNIGKRLIKTLTNIGLLFEAKIIVKALRGESGLEIGGPSGLFKNA